MNATQIQSLAPFCLPFEDYLTCALWSSLHYEGEESDPIPFDAVDAELSPETEKSMREELADFANLIEREGIESIPLDELQIAHDFWLTRNGHGAGFWDRGIGELGEQLSKLAKTYGSLELYLGDDGLIYSS